MLAVNRSSQGSIHIECIYVKFVDTSCKYNYISDLQNYVSPSRSAAILAACCARQPR